MSRQRKLKQMTYASGCLGTVIIVIVLFSLIAGFGGGGSPAVTTRSMPASFFKPLEIEQVDVIRSSEAVDVVARIRNPNPDAGVESLPVTFTPEQGVSQTVVSYILPGSVQYVVLLNQPLAALVGAVDVALGEVAYQKIPAGMDLPQFNAFVRASRISNVGGRQLETLQGSVGNASQFDLSQVEVVGLAFAADGDVRGIGQTLIGELKAGEERDITLQWPVPAVPTVRVSLVASTNIFAKNAILRIMGDPSTLR